MTISFSLLFVIKVNSQLLEAIQQKVELSQQLEEWKVDMEALLEEQIRERLVESERRSRRVAHSGEAGNGNGVSGAANAVGTKLLSFFQRS